MKILIVGHLGGSPGAVHITHSGDLGLILVSLFPVCLHQHGAAV